MKTILGEMAINCKMTSFFVVEHIGFPLLVANRKVKGAVSCMHALFSSVITI